MLTAHCRVSAAPSVLIPARLPHQGSQAPRVIVELRNATPTQDIRILLEIQTAGSSHCRSKCRVETMTWRMGTTMVKEGKKEIVE
jgi:hypothetical protein